MKISVKYQILNQISGTEHLSKNMDKQNLGNAKPITIFVKYIYA